MGGGALLRISLECSKEGATRSDVILREWSPERSGGQATEESSEAAEESKDELGFLAETVLSVARFFAFGSE